MSRPTNLRRTLPASVLIAVIITVIFVWKPFSASRDWVWAEIPLRSSENGLSILGCFTGPSLSDRAMSDCPVVKGEQVLRHRVPAGSHSVLWLRMVDSPATVAVGPARIVSQDGDILWRAPLEAWAIAPELSPAVRDGWLQASALADPPTGTLSMGKGIRLESGRAVSGSMCAAIAAILALVIAAAGAVWEPFFTRVWDALGRMKAGAGKWAEIAPATAIALVAAVAVGLACFPVIFLGKSFVSPSMVEQGLYVSKAADLGITSGQVEDDRGSDALAIQVAHRPYSVHAHNAILRDGAFPLWNRYNSCGDVYVGQGQSMLGDPLQWLPIAANGASWAWDVKFLAARWLFALGIGLCVWNATRKFPVAACAAFGAAFMGFFAYRFNHPATFSVCYAPLIFLCWQRIASAGSVRAAAGWALALAFVCSMVYHSGTAKESAMLVAFMNISGGLLVMGARRSGWLVHFVLGCLGTAVFALINAPFLAVFLDALGKSFTVYEKPPVLQIPAGNLVGLFDDLFYQRVTFGERLFCPSANIVVLAGLLIAIPRFREVWRSPVVRAVAVSSVIPFLLAFGIIPPSVVWKIPFIANISHVGNTFSCILIVHALIVAGVAWSAAPVRREWTIYVSAFAVLLAVYWMVPVPDAGVPLESAQAMGFGVGSPFFWVVATLLAGAVVVLPVVVLSLRKSDAVFPRLALAVVAGVCFFRHAQWDETAFDYYVVNPKERADFSVVPPVIEQLRPLLAEPSRVHGIDRTLVPGFSASLGLEHIGSGEALSSRWVRELLNAANFEHRWGWWTTFTAPGLAQSQKWTDLLNNRYFLAPRGKIPGTTFRRVLSADLDLWESPTAWPRAFFTDGLASYRSLGDFVGLVGKSNGPFAAAQNVEPIAGSGAVVPAKNYELKTNGTRFEIDAPAVGVAVLTESFYEGDFRVTLNGAPAEVFRANHAFLGVRVPAAGKYTVEFSYWPRVLSKALWAACAGFVIALALAGVALFGFPRRVVAA